MTRRLLALNTLIVGVGMLCLGLRANTYDDAVPPKRFTEVKAFSQPSEFDLDPISADDSLNCQDIVGKLVTLPIFDADGKARYRNRHVCDMVRACDYLLEIA